MNTRGPRGPHSARLANNDVIKYTKQPYSFLLLHHLPWQEARLVEYILPRFIRI